MGRKKPIALAAFLLVGGSAAQLYSQTVSYMTYASPAGIFKKFITTATTYLARDGGQVGIGTANPTAKLDVAGTFALRDGTQADGKILTSDANGLASWKPKASEPVFAVCSNASSAASCVEAAQNHGMGTANYRALSCKYAAGNSGLGYLSSSLMRYHSGHWQWWYAGSTFQWLDCDDGTVVVMNLNAGI